MTVPDDLIDILLDNEKSFNSTARGLAVDCKVFEHTPANNHLAAYKSRAQPGRFSIARSLWSA